MERPTLRFERFPEATVINILNNNVHVVSNHGVLVAAAETYSLHPIYGFISGVLLTFLQLKCPDSPTAFETHPKSVLVCVAAFVLYCFAFCTKLKFAMRLDTLMEAFSSLSLVSLVLMLLPDTWGSFKFIIGYTIWLLTHLLLPIIGNIFNFTCMAATSSTYEEGAFSFDMAASTSSSSW